MKVVIENSDTEEKRVINNVDDCKDEHEKSLYNTVLKFDCNYSISMGILHGYVQR